MLCDIRSVEIYINDAKFYLSAAEKINFAQFFTFGYLSSTLADEGYSFDFSDFVSNKSGRASMNMKLQL